MPRVVHIRDSYAGDVARLARLAEAVGKDIKRPEEWRREVQRKVSDLMMILIQTQYTSDARDANGEG